MQRRSFVKSVLGTVVLYSSKTTLFGQNAPSNTVRVAVMGCHAGGRGMSLLGTLSKLPGVEIVAVCDVDSRARVAATARVMQSQKKQPQQVVDIRQVMDDQQVDAVLCAAPDHWHAPVALMSMRAGKAIYVEKPCSHNPREGEMLVEAAAKYRSVFQMGNQRRSSPVYQATIKAIHDGVIGEPKFARCWYATRRQPIGKGQAVAVPEWLDWDLWQGPAPRTAYRDNIVHYNWHWFLHWGTGESGNNATHFVDVARWALGVTYPERVTSAGGRLFYSDDDWEWFDTQTATYNFPGNKFMTWEGLSAVNARPYEGIATGCMVYGLDGAVLFAPNDSSRQFDGKGKEVKVWNNKVLAGDAENRSNPTANLDAVHLGNWIECIRERRVATRTAAPDAHASTLLTQLANISQRTGEVIKIDPTTGKLAAGSAGAELWGRQYAEGWEPNV